MGFFLRTMTALINFAQTIALSATYAFIYWLVLDHVVGVKFDYLPVLGVTYIYGVAARTIAHHFVAKPTLVYQYQKIGGKDYVFAADINTFRYDVQLARALQKGMTGQTFSE